VGTPGRIMDHMRRKTIKLEDVKMVVLDEADEMLNMGFIEDVEEILSHASENRQTMLFSATMPPAIKNLAKRFMKPDADHIAVKNVSMTVDKVEQYYYEIKHRDRFESLCRILDATDYSNVLIFCNTKVNVDKLTDHLKGRGYDVDSMHGDINQAQRMRVLSKFKDGAIEILVATDVAARGIDVENITHVINYDLPQDLEAYVHRIGRTGRAGRSGVALTLVTPREYMAIKRIEKVTHSKILRKEIPTVEDIFESKYSSMVNEISEELEKGEYKKFLPHVLKLDEDHNLAEVAAALMIMRYRDEVSFDYTKNKLDEGNANARVFMTVGKMDGLNPLKLLKFLQSNVKVDSRDIGDIEILEKFSFFEVRRDLVNEVIDACRGKELLGRKVAMELAEGRDKRKSRPNRSNVDRNRGRSSRRKKMY
jgi:ATP-dependent RNA helicase DeaD